VHSAPFFRSFRGLGLYFPDSKLTLLRQGRITLWHSIAGELPFTTATISAERRLNEFNRQEAYNTGMGMCNSELSGA